MSPRLLVALDHGGLLLAKHHRAGSVCVNGSVWVDDVADVVEVTSKAVVVSLACASTASKREILKEDYRGRFLRKIVNGSGPRRHQDRRASFSLPKHLFAVVLSDGLQSEYASEDVRFEPVALAFHSTQEGTTIKQTLCEFLFIPRSS